MDYRSTKKPEYEDAQYYRVTNHAFNNKTVIVWFFDKPVDIAYDQRGFANIPYNRIARINFTSYEVLDPGQTKIIETSIHREDSVAIAYADVFTQRPDETDPYGEDICLGWEAYFPPAGASGASGPVEIPTPISGLQDQCQRVNGNIRRAFFTDSAISQDFGNFYWSTGDPDGLRFYQKPEVEGIGAWDITNHAFNNKTIIVWFFNKPVDIMFDENGFSNLPYDRVNTVLFSSYEIINPGQTKVVESNIHRENSIALAFADTFTFNANQTDAYGEEVCLGWERHIPTAATGPTTGASSPIVLPPTGSTGPATGATSPIVLPPTGATGPTDGATTPTAGSTTPIVFPPTGSTTPTTGATEPTTGASEPTIIPPIGSTGPEVIDPVLGVRTHLIANFGGNDTLAAPLWTLYTDVYTDYTPQEGNYRFTNNEDYTIRVFHTNDGSGFTGHTRGECVLPHSSAVYRREAMYVAYGAFNADGFDIEEWISDERAIGRNADITVTRTNQQIFDTRVWMSTAANRAPDLNLFTIRAFIPTREVNVNSRSGNLNDDAGDYEQSPNRVRITNRSPYPVNVWYSPNENVVRMNDATLNDADGVSDPIPPGRSVERRMPFDYMFFTAHDTGFREADWPEEGLFMDIDVEIIDYVSVLVPFAEGCRLNNGQVSRAYYDDMTRRNPYFSFSHFSGPSNTNNPKVVSINRDSDGHVIKVGETYDIGLYSIIEREFGDVDSFNSIRIWWSNNSGPNGPFILADDPVDRDTGNVENRRKGVVSPGEFKTLVAPATHIFIGAVDHNVEADINEQPQEGTEVCMMVDKAGTGGPSGPEIPPGIGASGPSRPGGEPDCEYRAYLGTVRAEGDIAPITTEAAWTHQKWQKPLSFISFEPGHRYEIRLNDRNAKFNVRLFFWDDLDGPMGRVDTLIPGPTIMNNNAPFIVTPGGRYGLLSATSNNTGKNFTQWSEWGECVDIDIRDMGPAPRPVKKTYWSNRRQSGNIELPHWALYLQPIYTQAIEPDMVYKFTNRSDYKLVPWIDTQNNFTNASCSKMSVSSPSYVVDDTGLGHPEWINNGLVTDEVVYFWIPRGRWQYMRFSTYDSNQPEAEWTPEARTIDYDMEIEPNVMRSYLTVSQNVPPEFTRYQAVFHQSVTKNKHYEITNREDYPVRLWWTDNMRGTNPANNRYNHQAGEWIMPNSSIKIKAEDHYFVPVCYGQSDLTEADFLPIGRRASRITYKQIPSLTAVVRTYPQATNGGKVTWSDYTRPNWSKSVKKKSTYRIKNDGDYDLVIYFNSNNAGTGTFKKSDQIVKKGVSKTVEALDKYMYFGSITHYGPNQWPRNGYLQDVSVTLATEAPDVGASRPGASHGASRHTKPPSKPGKPNNGTSCWKWMKKFFKTLGGGEIFAIAIAVLVGVKIAQRRVGLLTDRLQAEFR